MEDILVVVAAVPVDLPTGSVAAVVGPAEHRADAGMEEYSVAEVDILEELHRIAAADILVAVAVAVVVVAHTVLGLEEHRTDLIRSILACSCRHHFHPRTPSSNQTLLVR